MVRATPSLLLLLLGCASARSATVPTEVTEPHALQATRCGEVTALWRGSPPDGSAPLSFFAQSLSFRFADGIERPFKPAGKVEPPHASLELFSPDCRYVALAQDSYGPFHLVPVAGLADYLEGRRAPLIVKPPAASTAPILTEPRWLGPTRFEFFASCCGAVEVFRLELGAPEQLERVFFAPEAPAGIRRTDGGFELNR